MSRKYNKRLKTRRSTRRTRPKRKSRTGYKRKTSRGRPKKKMSKLSRTCKTRLRNKIKINLDEYKKGRYSSRQQAIAVSYAQVKKKYPKCSRSLRKK